MNTGGSKIPAGVHFKNTIPNHFNTNSICSLHSRYLSKLLRNSISIYNIWNCVEIHLHFSKSTIWFFFYTHFFECVAQIFQSTQLYRPLCIDLLCIGLCNRKELMTHKNSPYNRWYCWLSIEEMMLTKRMQETAQLIGVNFANSMDNFDSIVTNQCQCFDKIS